MPAYHTASGFSALSFQRDSSWHSACNSRRMKWFVLLLVAAGRAWNQDATQDVNVNSRYTIEAVEVGEKYESKLSPRLKSELNKVVGEKFDQATIDRLGSDSARSCAATRWFRRSSVARSRRQCVSCSKSSAKSSTRILSCQGSSITPGRTGVLAPMATSVSSGHHMTFGMLTDNDERLERYSGIRGGYERETEVFAPALLSKVIGHNGTAPS